MRPHFKCTSKTTEFIRLGKMAMKTRSCYFPFRQTVYIVHCTSIFSKQMHFKQRHSLRIKVHSKQMKQVAFVVDAGVVINVLYDIYLSILSRMIFFFSWLFRLGCIDVSRRPAHPFRKHSRYLAVFVYLCTHFAMEKNWFHLLRDKHKCTWQ